MEKLLSEVALRLKPEKRIKGERFNYKITHPIGRGGSGIVYRSQCVETNADVAIKFFLPLYEINLSLFESSTTQQRTLYDLERFHKKELECLREVHHSYIVRVLLNPVK